MDRPGAGDTMSTFGVLADERSGTLWVCSNNVAGMGVPPPGGVKPVALKAFDLRTRALKASYPLPGDATFCNDVAVAGDGTVYVAESNQPHVLRLRPGASALEVWAPHADFGGGAVLDGIAIGSDGNVYVNTFKTGRLFRIVVQPDGRAGQITALRTSKPLDRPDGMRRLGPRTLLMIEGGGRPDIVRLDGDDAKIDVIKEGFNGPVSVVQVGNIAWVVEGHLDDLFSPKPGAAPPRFSAFPVALPAGAAGK